MVESLHFAAGHWVSCFHWCLLSACAETCPPASNPMLSVQASVHCMPVCMPGWYAVRGEPHALPWLPGYKTLMHTAPTAKQSISLADMTGAQAATPELCKTACSLQDSHGGWCGRRCLSRLPSLLCSLTMASRGASPACRPFWRSSSRTCTITPRTLAMETPPTASTTTRACSSSPPASSSLQPSAALSEGTPQGAPPCPSSPAPMSGFACADAAHMRTPEVSAATGAPQRNADAVLRPPSYSPTLDMYGTHQEHCMEGSSIHSCL